MNTGLLMARISIIAQKEKAVRVVKLKPLFLPKTKVTERTELGDYSRCGWKFNSIRHLYLGKQMEQWRDIPDYEGLYQASNLGRIRRIKPYRNSTADGIIKAFVNGGYLKLTLCKNNNRKFCTVHRLVATAFLDADPSRPEVNHIDGDKLNNNLSNLEFVTSKGNRQHASQLGLLSTGDEHYSRKHPEKMKRGADYWSTKLTIEQVREIKKMIGDRAYTQQQIADHYKVSKSTIAKISQGKFWKYV